MNKIQTRHVIFAVEIMTDIVIDNEVYFCELDSVAGDGDFGMSLAKGFRQVKAERDNICKTDIGCFMNGCGMIITEYCGGASGPIWGSAFRAFGRATKGREELSLQELYIASHSAVGAIQKIGGAKLGDKTLLDALIPAVDALDMADRAGKDILSAMRDFAVAALAGAEKTRGMIASRGRASYVGERSINHPDAGAMALGILFTGIADKFETAEL